MKHVYSFKGDPIAMEGKLVEYFKDLANLFNDMAQEISDIKLEELKTIHKKGYQLYQVIPE